MAKADTLDVRTPDAFHTTSAKIFKIIEANSKVVIWIAGAILAAAVAFLLYSNHKTTQETMAADALYKVESELTRMQSTIRQDRAKQMADIAAGKSKAKASLAQEVRPENFDQDFKPLVENWLRALAKHPNTKASLVSALNLSFFLIEQKQYDLAKKPLENVKFRPAQADLLNGFYLMHKGLLSLESKQYDEAISAYDQLLAEKALASFFSEAMLRKGVAFEFKGMTDKAREVFLEVARKFPQTEAENTARQYLRIMDLSKTRQG